MKLNNKKGDLAIDSVIKLAIVIFVAIIVLSIVLPLLLSQEGSGACVGPRKGVASVLADMTGVNMC